MGVATSILSKGRATGPREPKGTKTSIGKKNINGSPNNKEKIETEVIAKYDHFMPCRRNNDTSEHLPFKPRPLTSSIKNSF